jgi:hypothetical protein
MQTPTTNQPPKPPDAKTGQSNDKPAIAVKRIVFDGVIDFPERAAADSVTCAKRSDVFDADGKRINRQKYYLVEYRPWMRHFVVTHYPASQAGTPTERMVPEGRVRSWDPA